MYIICQNQISSKSHKLFPVLCRAYCWYMMSRWSNEPDQHWLYCYRINLELICYARCWARSTFAFIKIYRILIWDIALDWWAKLVECMLGWFWFLSVKPTSLTPIACSFWLVSNILITDFAKLWTNHPVKQIYAPIGTFIKIITVYSVCNLKSNQT